LPTTTSLGFFIDAISMSQTRAALTADQSLRH